MRYLFSAMLAVVAASAPAMACDAEFTSKSETVNVVGTDVGVGRFVTETIPVAIRNRGGEACSLTVRLSREEFGPDGLSYSLHSGSQTLTAAASESVGDVSSDVRVSVAAGFTGTPLPLLLHLPMEWGVKAGTHTDRLSLSLMGPSGAVVDRLRVTLNVTVPPAVTLRLVGAIGDGAAAQVELGPIHALRETRSLPFGIRIWSTSGYRVELSSRNRGRLLHEKGAHGIPYLLTLDGRPVVVSGASIPFSVPRHTNSLGDYHPLGIVVPPVSAVAGTYTDQITVSVTAI